MATCSRPTAIGAALALLIACDASAAADQAGEIQAALETWLAARAPIEKVTGIAAYVSFGDPGPAIEAFAGKVGRGADDGAGGGGAGAPGDTGAGLRDLGFWTFGDLGRTKGEG